MHWKHGRGACERSPDAARRTGSARDAVCWYAIDARKLSRMKANGLFPGRFIHIPALALECPCQCVDRAVIVGLLAFLVAAGLFAQIELSACGFVRRRNDGIADPQH